jgi:hypothetical protein
MTEKTLTFSGKRQIRVPVLGFGLSYLSQLAAHVTSLRLGVECSHSGRADLGQQPGVQRLEKAEGSVQTEIEVR